MTETPGAGFERRVEIDEVHGKYTVSRLALTETQVSEFYPRLVGGGRFGRSCILSKNATIRPRRLGQLPGVNRRFARRGGRSGRGPLVGVHDYNLWLVRATCARSGRSAHRLHPSHAVSAAACSTCCPGRNQIGGKLLRCDDVGFHIRANARNFRCRSLRSLFDVEVRRAGAVCRKCVHRRHRADERLIQRPAPLRPRRPGLVTFLPLGVAVSYIGGDRRRPRRPGRLKEIFIWSDLKGRKG